MERQPALSPDRRQPASQPATHAWVPGGEHGLRSRRQGRRATESARGAAAKAQFNPAKKPRPAACRRPAGFATGLAIPQAGLFSHQAANDGRRAHCPDPRGDNHGAAAGGHRRRQPRGA
ncbi:MAG TPA: hypothetical protein VGE07_00935, partial [Herpetosiphonaceae bacterium]